jgi:hypothetical protein
MPVIIPAYDRQTITWTISTTGVSGVSHSLTGMKNLLHSFKLSYTTMQASAATAVYFSITDDDGDALFTTSALTSAATAKTSAADVMLVGDISLNLWVNTATGMFTAGQTAPTASVDLYLY